MNSRRVLAVVVLVALMGSVTVRADESPLAQNAALQYWKAFASLPELSKEQDNAVRKALEDGTIDQPLRKVIASSKSAFHELRKGAAMAECCWGVSVEEGPNATLPHLSKARQLARIACLRAEAAFARGEASEAMKDIEAVMILGRHTGKDALIISLLIDYAIERIAINTIAANLPSLNQEQLQSLAQRLESLPAQPTVVDAVRVDQELLAGWMIQILSESDGKEQLIALLSGAIPGSAEEIVKHSREELLAAAKDVHQFYDRWVEAVAKSPEEVKQAEKRLIADPGIKGPGRELALGLVPAIGSARAAEAEHQTRLALVEAAIAVQLEGPDALKSETHRDPFGSGSFDYKKTANGFELQSSFADRKGEPVSLVVGRP